MKKRNIIIGVIVLILFVVGIIGKNLPQEKPAERKTMEEAIDEPEEEEPEPTPAKDYELIESYNKGAETIAILISDTLLSKKAITKIAFEARNRHCSTSCNVKIFNSRLGQKKSRQYPIPEKEYVFVADTFVAMLDSESDFISFSPYNDFRYNNFGGTKTRERFTD